MVSSLVLSQNSCSDSFSGSQYPTAGFSFVASVLRSATVSIAGAAARMPTAETAGPWKASGADVRASCEQWGSGCQSDVLGRYGRAKGRARERIGHHRKIY